MERTYTVYPPELEGDFEDVDDNLQGEYCDQFDLPFLRDYAEQIDRLAESGTRPLIELSVRTERGAIISLVRTRPTNENYLGGLDSVFEDFLWAHGTDQVLLVTVTMNNTEGPSN